MEPETMSAEKPRKKYNYCRDREPRILNGGWTLLADFARVYGRSDQTIRRYLKQDLIQGKKIGNRWFIHESMLRKAV